MKKCRYLTSVLCLLSSILCPLTHAGTEIDIALTSVSGTIPRSSCAASFKIKGYRTGISGNFRRAEMADRRVEDQGRLRLMYDPKLTDSWSLWFFSEIGYDDMRGIELENYIGCGPKYTFIDTDRTEVSLSAGVLYHHIDYDGAGVVPQRLARASVRPRAKIKYGNWEAGCVGYYQPALENKDDYILRVETAVRYALTGAIGLKLTIEDERISKEMTEYNERITTLAVSVRQ